MRLLNTATLELHEFFESQVPPYVILSHRWEDDEIKLKDVVKRRNLKAKGWSKVKSCCAFAREDGYEWLWIDTCCIDKASSAELSEALNSMFRWYESAERCYAYLCDVSCEQGDLCSRQEIASWSDRPTAVRFWMSKDEDVTSPDLPLQTSGLRDGLAAAFRASRWFTRGWTLQELLAPCALRFIDKDWKGVFGSKVSLNAIVSQISGIPNAGFRTANNMRFMSIAARMSWASRRVCTRAEDTAYSLLGIFGVHMPLLYGEGAYRAFLRLQLEILKESDDESIFAWYPGVLPPSSRKEIRGGLLASSPADFSLPMLSKVRPNSQKTRATRQPFIMTHKGLAITTFLYPAEGYDAGTHKKYLRMPLKCYISNEKNPLSIHLIRLGSNTFERVLGPVEELVQEFDLKTLIANELRYRTEGIREMDEHLIYIPQSPYPELMAVKSPVAVSPPLVCIPLLPLDDELEDDMDD